MKNFITILMVFFISIFIIPENYIRANSGEVKIFSPQDAQMLGILMGMKKNETEKILGEPLKKESQYQEAFGLDVYTYFYEFGKIVLEPIGIGNYIVTSLYTDQPSCEGPRNIKVGDNINSVLEKFSYNKNNTIEKEGDTLIKYIYDVKLDNYSKHGEIFGLIEYDNNNKVSAVKYVHKSLVLYLKVKNDKISSIALVFHAY